MTRRYSVKTATRTEEVGADEARIGHGGVLEFWIDGGLAVAYARHAWVEVEFDYEEEQS